MKRWTASLAISFILFLFHSPVFSNLPVVHLHEDAPGDLLGSSVASAGDFNGDGIEDIIVGAFADGVNGQENVGSAFIFYGRNTTSLIELMANADADVIIQGQNNGDNLGISVASAGDFNGDGFDDVIISAPGYNTNGIINSGSVFIFFGRNTYSQQILQANTDADVIIEGQSAFGWFGNSVAPAGDFNGDGLGDVIAGAQYDANNGLANSGNAFIFFGQNPSSQITLNPDTDADVTLDGRIPYDNFGQSVASAGDFNGDGLNDVIVGADFDGNQAGEQSGSAFIFFGRNTTGQINLSAGTDANIILDGEYTGDAFGFSVASTGDFNGDGLSDIVVGAPGSSNNGEILSGSAYIFFGQNTSAHITLNADADADIIMDGQSGAPINDPYGIGDLFGFFVASAGDFNGDGKDDVIVAATRDDNNGKLDSGSAFIFFGQNPSTQIKLRADADADFIFNGQDPFENFGISMASAGNFNGDGIDDVIVGAYGNASIFAGSNPDAPTISVLGDATILVDSGAIYVDAGATASDVEDGDITSNIVISGLPIDTNILGSHTVTYQVTDSSGNSAQAVRTVKVRNNIIPPVLTILGSNPVTIETRTTYTDAGATALDDVDGDITTSIVVGGLPISTFWEGTHTITYDVTDSAGNTVHAERTVNVVDTIPPHISVLGFKPATVEFGSTYFDSGAIATDHTYGDLTFSMVVGGLPVDTTVLGSHIVTYDVADVAGNTAHAERVVNVVNTEPPVVIAPANVTAEATGATTPVTIGTATATDNVFVASITNNAPAAFPLGLTVVTWTATDAAGNTGTATQNVTVQDTTAPTLTLLGSNPITVEGGTTYIDAGATATDIVDGDLTVSIIVGGLPIDTSVVGTHTVTYDVTDSSGNSAAQATRTVNVVDATPPVVTPPADVTVDQTGDLTPVSIGTATATDNIAVASLTNDAPAGDYPVGATVVSWTATDSSGNAASVTQQVTVNPVPLVQLQLLKNYLSSLNLSSGLFKKIDKKLNQAGTRIANGDNAGAIQDLQSFINTVQSNTPSKISQADADAMIQRAQAIIALL